MQHFLRLAGMRYTLHEPSLGAKRMSDDEHEDPVTLFGRRIPEKRPPLWLRILLMAILIALAAVGFYFTNQVTFDRVLDR